ncbi:MAG: helix-turn-helix domain-containing protein [Microthrixaceae bacterium]
MSNPVVSEIRAEAGEREQLTEVLQMIVDAKSTIIVRVGDDQVELPPALVRLLVAGASPLREGDSVAVVSEDAAVSPAQAAQLLGVSRQYVDRLISSGVLPARRLPHSRYRKIPVRAVLAHKSTKDAKRDGITSIVDAAEQAGLSY